MITVTKRDLIELGYGPSFAADIIKKAKELMVEKGHTYYQSRKLDRVPKEAVEELLGITQFGGLFYGKKKGFTTKSSA